MALKKKSVKTVKPAGPTITRSGGAFTASWKIGDKDYSGGQTLRWRVNKGKWYDIGVTTTTTAKAIPLNLNNFYPAAGKSTLVSLQIAVRGKRKAYKTTKNKIVPTVSGWAFQTMNFSIPPRPPVVTGALNDTYSNVATYSWGIETDNSSAVVFRDCQWESILVKNCQEYNGAKLAWNSSQLGWQTGTTGASGSITITEDSSLLTIGTHTRWVRVRSRGSRGSSGWTYGHHTYAVPYRARIVSASATIAPTGGYFCMVEWNAQADISRPIDKVVVEYSIVTPEAGMACPENASWTEAKTISDTSENDGAAFSVESTAGADECLFIRVNTYHDKEITTGVPTLVDVGHLSEPSNLTVSTNDQTYRATVTATNNSAVSDSFLAIRYMTESNPSGFIIGIIPHGQAEVTVQCPVWTSTTSIRFAVFAVVGSYTQTIRADGVSSYAIAAKMESFALESGGTVPQAPSTVTLLATEIPGTIRVTWDWAWQEADSAELSWADHDDAWESTDGPETYSLDNSHASRWNISGLETGVTWYVRVRLATGTGDDKTYGAYSQIASIDLSSAPAIPVLSLSDGVITEDSSVTASWSYVSTDGTLQAFAEVAEVTTVNNETVYTTITQTQTAQYVTINAKEAGWVSGESHLLAVRVVSQSGKQSERWSDPVPVIVAEPITATISQVSLEEKTIIVDNVERTIMALTAMPFTITVTGAGTGGTTSVVIERAQTYQMARPDESDFIGYEGETIAIHTQTGEGQIVIEQDSDDMLGYLDDGAAYRIIATIQDGLGQSAEAKMDFEVHWNHQALMPSAKVISDQENIAAIITPVAPSGIGVGDVCDIYRLSVDKPQLVYPNAVFGQKYVDPFPTLGEYGGHRIVFKTVNGDYITEDNELAWVDLVDIDGDYFESPSNLIDFGSGRVALQYNIDLSNKWKKDFKETKYLGGSVQGDWNPAVSRTGSIASVVIASQDQDTIEAMRRLAVHSGICHVRTKDGSSYAADVEVSESYQHGSGHRIVEFSLDITRVDPETYDGMTYAEWVQTREI